MAPPPPSRRLGGGDARRVLRVVLAGLLVPRAASTFTGSYFTTVDGIQAFDVAGAERTGDPRYLAGYGTASYYSPLVIDDPSRMEASLTSPGSTFLYRFRNASVTRTGDRVMVEMRNISEYHAAVRALYYQRTA